MLIYIHLEGRIIPPFEEVISYLKYNMVWMGSFISLAMKNIGLSFLSGLHTAKLVLANPSWCVWTAQKQAANTFANCWRQIETCLPTVFNYAVHRHQLEFANTSVPTLVCRVKAA